MRYADYYLQCRNSYEGVDNSSVERFYLDPVFEIPTSLMGDEYLPAVESLAKGVREDFDAMTADPIMTKHNDLWKYRDEINKISLPLVRYLEQEKYGCYLYVDKIYIYRTAKFENRESSYLWHYDNNPLEIIKNIIYLNDVDEKNSPFEYLQTPNGNGVSVNPSRTGTDQWNPAPNNSRMTEDQMNSLFAQGYKPHQVLGKIGTTYAFCNSAIHRANPVIEGYRDVINIRVKPTIILPSSPVDPRWTSGFETSGAVLPDPRVDWTTYIKGERDV